MRRMITQTASALLALLLLFGLAACGSKPQDYTSSGDAASMPADGSTGKRVLADGRQPDKDMSAAPDEGTEQEALAWLREFMAEYAPQAAIAAAYLGCRGADDTTSLTEWLWDNSPGLMEEMPFIRTIPPVRILGPAMGTFTASCRGTTGPPCQ